MIAEPAPILLFCYKRLEVLKTTILELQKNFLAQESDLYIFSDGPKNLNDQVAINRVRVYLKTIQGFKKIKIFESYTNKGLANSIIDGVTQMFEIFDKVIVLEDDLLTSKNFLSYMNQCLNHYEQHKEVFSISGYSFPIKKQNIDVYFTKRSSSWGWATWKDRWDIIDWNVSDYNNFKKSIKLQKSFNQMGSDLSSMLKKQMEGHMDSWAIRWCYHQFKEDLFTVYPIISKVVNNGFSDGATHTFDTINKYNTVLDQSGNVNFEFPKPHLEKEIIKIFTSKFSLLTRISYRSINILAKLFKK